MRHFFVTVASILLLVSCGGKTSNEKVLLEMLNILIVYDTDKMIPVYGFGGTLKGKRNVSHCF